MNGLNGIQMSYKNGMLWKMFSSGHVGKWWFKSALTFLSLAVNLSGVLVE